MVGGNEPSAPSSWRFSIDVARAWERALDEPATPHTRKVALRSAMTMSPDRGGIFDALLALVRRGLGGVAGDGRQFISWIHHADFVRAVRWLIDHDELDGVVNVSAPNPLPNREFMRLLREAAGVPVGLPAKRLMLEIGALFMRTETELILKSRRVVPTRLLESGFEFSFPDWRDAAIHLCREWRSARRATPAAASAPAPARRASAYRSA
jgi:NAD dependent epimerase/dehydratase family enzyme